MQPIGKSSQCDVPPKFISRAAPIYPISRLRRGESGYADIVFTVDETGHTRDFNVWKTTYLYFANHAILAVQNWRFQPSFKMDILYPAVFESRSRTDMAIEHVYEVRPRCDKRGFDQAGSHR